MTMGALGDDDAGPKLRKSISQDLTQSKEGGSPTPVASSGVKMHQFLWGIRALALRIGS